MKRLIQQKGFFLRDGLEIFDEEGELRFTVDYEFNSLPRKLRLRDTKGKELALISRKFSPLRPVFTAALGEAELRIVKKATMFKQIYEIRPLGWLTEEDPTSREYLVREENREIARIALGALTRNSRTEIAIGDEKNELSVICTALVVRSVLEGAASMKA